MEHDICHIYIYGMVSDILCLYVWAMIYVIFLYGSILLILSICKKLFIYIIYHRPFGLKQIILLLVLHILLCQSLILNSMAPAIKKDIVMCHGIAEYSLCKSEAVTPQAKGVTTEVTPQAQGLPTSPQMTPTSAQMSPLMSSPSSASLDMSTNEQSTNEQSKQSTKELKYPPPGSLSTADKSLYNKINFKLKNAAMPEVVHGQ